MGFQSGLSGLNASAKNIDIIGNNVANSNTVGYKSSRAVFADVFASSLSGAGSSNIGIGTKIAQVQQEFTQGNITVTANPLDIAINGRGFMRLDNNGAVAYSRNGQLHLDENGFIVNGDNLRPTRDAEGRTTSVNPCWGDYRTARSDNCTSDVEERAWASPIYVNAPRRR